MNSVANINRLGYVGSKVRGTVDSENDDWYTPSMWVSIARRVMGGIDLDPFSSDLANQRVMARQYYTEENSSLNGDWNASTVWMNPPYTRGIIDRAVDKFIEQYKVGNFKTGVVLVNNMTDTQWYRRIANVSSMRVELTGRIGFENASGQRISGNTRGQVLFLITKSPHAKAKFIQEMQKINQQVLSCISVSLENNHVTR